MDVGEGAGDKKSLVQRKGRGVFCLLPEAAAHCSFGHRHPMAEWKQKGPWGPAGCLRKAWPVKGVLKLAPPAQPAECPSALRTGKSQRTEDTPAPTTMG